MRVIGTAGHVDHGKSTLIRALTGIDPDRLREEKERGMTIDLGFAWLKLPGGTEVSIVDVPGHERFVHNMLAGVGGIDIALLVIAADEGIMPQTREHLDILDLLGIGVGVVAVTKTDLVEPDWLEMVLAEIEDGLKETSLARAPMVPVSATTGQGLDTLLQTLEETLKTERTRASTGRPRLPVDRVFTMPGFGTIVTGTLVDGSLQIGQELDVEPAGKHTRVRGLQSHQRKIESVPAGTRVAVNISGLATDEIHRGDVLCAPGSLRATRLLDVRLQVVRDADRPLKHNAEITFHTGSAETTGKVALLDELELESGASGFAQIRLNEPVAVNKGDLFVLRFLTPARTIGGGSVIEPHPRRHRRFQSQILEGLEVLEQGTPAEIVLQQLQRHEPTDLKDLLSRGSLATEALAAALGELTANGSVIALDGSPETDADIPVKLLPTTLLVSTRGWDELVSRSMQVLEQFHQAYPLRPGLPREELRARLGLDSRTFNRVQERLSRQNVTAEEGPLVRSGQHRVVLTPDQESQAQLILSVLKEGAASPPSRQTMEHDLAISSELVQALVDRGDLVEVAEDLVYERQTYDAIVMRIVEALKESGTISVAQVRDLLATSRRYALALVAHLDDKRITRRVGDERVLM